MEDCAQNHEVCRWLGTPDSGDWLPTRLIDCSGPGHVRIIETSEKMDRVRYVALSYVWGKGPPESQAHRTTTDNLSARIRVGIATETLPRTIRDAIYVTRTLGFYFLWIDSLCIIQNSDEDKHREVRSMARVYRHAYLTIDAATAASVEDGFLQDRPLPHDRDDIVFPLVCPASPGDGHVQAEARMGNVYFPRMGSSRKGHVYFPKDIFAMGRRLYSNAIGFEPSSDERPQITFKNETRLRGWCLQETMLSTRSLIFDVQSLSVKCQTRPSPRHVGFDRDRGQVSGLYDVIPDPISGSAIDVRPGSDEWKKIHRRWQEIAMNYSNRSLTCPGDKLLACAAIAEVFHPHLGKGYLAGSWPQTILHDLLWHVQSEPPRPPKYPHAPSWSWLSANAEINFFHKSSSSATLRLVAEVVDHSIALQHETLHFGPVLPGGHLVLRAPLLSGKHHRDVYRFEYQQFAFEFPDLSFCIHDDHSEDPDIGNVFLVPIAIDVNADSEEDSHPQAYGIMIAQAEWSISQSARFQDHSKVYQRTGLWSHIGEDPEEWRLFIRMLQVVPKVEIVLV
ncbi:HET-domain-containing protein [Cubamyces sp. BRFM 1775]|nr:HET-domain-containing protein [Cubamyces sp. BRFM 1775]